MRLTVRSVVSSAACLGLSSFLMLSMGAAFAQSDPQVGIWKLNLAKSTVQPGPGPKSATTKIEAVGAGTKVSRRSGHWQTARRDTGNSPRTTTARTAP